MFAGQEYMYERDKFQLRVELQCHYKSLELENRYVL